MTAYIACSTTKKVCYSILTLLLKVLAVFLTSPTLIEIVSGSADKTIRIWQIREKDIGTHDEGSSITNSSEALDVSYIGNGNASTSVKGGIKCTKRLLGHTDAIMCLQYDRYNSLGLSLFCVFQSIIDDTYGYRERIITGSADNKIKIWDFVTGKCIVSARACPFMIIL